MVHSNSRLWAAVVMSFVAAAGSVARGESVPVEELRRELGEMKRQMQQMQKRIEKQEELIEKLSAPKAAIQETTPAPTRAETPPTPAPTATAAAPREPWSPTAPIRVLGGGRGYLNLSLDALVDVGTSTNPDVPSLELGAHDPTQRGVSMPSSEVVFEGGVDPYFKALATIVFALDEENETSVELEEMYGLTTSLPWNLQGKVGLYLAEFGRINQQHAHAWDFVDVPLVNAHILGPEGLRNPGARLSWLLPTPFYSELYGSVLNSQGVTAFSFRNEEEPPFGRAAVERPVSDLGDMLYVPRYVASFDLTDAQTLVVGTSAALGPNASGENTYTQIVGGDLYWKWKPAWQSGGFPFVSFQTEALGRRYEAAAGTTPSEDGPTIFLPAENLTDWGMYAQALYGFRRRWVAGLRGDWVADACGAAEPSSTCAQRYRIAPNITFYPTEFSKIRLQYNFDHTRDLGNDSSVWLQLELLLGDHAAHKF
jgi:hypothetical protein